MLEMTKNFKDKIGEDHEERSQKRLVSAEQLLEDLREDAKSSLAQAKKGESQKLFQLAQTRARTCLENLVDVLKLDLKRREDARIQDTNRTKKEFEAPINRPSRIIVPAVRM